MKELKKFPIPLTKLEKLMICNNPPETALQLSVVSIENILINRWLLKMIELCFFNFWLITDRERLRR